MNREEVPMDQNTTTDGSKVVKRLNDRAREQALRDAEDPYVPLSDRLVDDGKPVCDGVLSDSDVGGGSRSSGRNRRPWYGRR